MSSDSSALKEQYAGYRNPTIETKMFPQIPTATRKMTTNMAPVTSMPGSTPILAAPFLTNLNFPNSSPIYLSFYLTASIDLC